MNIAILADKIEGTSTEALTSVQEKMVAETSPNSGTECWLRGCSDQYQLYKQESDVITFEDIITLTAQH